MTLRLTTQEIVIRANETEPVRRIQLVPGAVLRLPRRQQRIQVIFGAAWITADGRDYAVRRGDSQLLKPGRYEALISPLGSRQILFDIETV